MKKLILSAVALVVLACQAVAQTPSAPSSTSEVTPPPPVVTTTPAPPIVSTQPTTPKEKANKNKGERKEERAWENHGKTKKDKKEHQKKKEERAERKEEQGKRKEERAERKEVRAEKLDRMRAYLNLTPDQESRMSTAIQSFRAGAKALKDNKNLSPEQKKIQLDKLVADRNAQLKAILNPEQLAKLAEAQKQAQAQNKAKNGFMSDELGDDDLF